MLDFLICVMISLMFDGSVSVGDMLSYFWLIMDGQLDVGIVIVIFIVLMSGIYILIIIDGDNGCIDSISVLVESDMDEFLLFIVDFLMVNCFNLQVELEVFIGSNIILFFSF